MRDYLTDLRENWTDEYWRADHPEFQMMIAIAGFLIISLLRTGVNIIDLLITRRITGAAHTAA